MTRVQPAEIADAIGEYRAIIQSFVDGQMAAEQFEAAYFPAYASSRADPPSAVFDIVDAFFADVDAFVADDNLRDETSGDLDEDQLRARAVELLRSAGHAT